VRSTKLSYAPTFAVLRPPKQATREGINREEGEDTAASPASQAESDVPMSPSAAEPLFLTRVKPDHAKIRELRRLRRRAGSQHGDILAP
jgi:hypothetical protein